MKIYQQQQLLQSISQLTRAGPRKETHKIQKLSMDIAINLISVGNDVSGVSDSGVTTRKASLFLEFPHLILSFDFPSAAP